MSKTYNDTLRRYAEVPEEAELTKDTIRDHRNQKRMIRAIKARRLEDIQEAEYEE